MTCPHLTRITIYPIKALDCLDVPEAAVLPGGTLEHDRRFAVVDAEGRFVNGKHTDRVHPIRTAYDLLARTVRVRIQGSDERRIMPLDGARDELSGCLSGWFGSPVRVIEDAGRGFPDDADAPGPTVLSMATL